MYTQSDIDSPHRPLAIQLNVAKIVISLIVIAAILLIFNIIGQYAKFFLGHGRLLGFVPKFHLDGEGNIPAFFSSVLLLFIGGLLFLIWRYKSQIRDPFSYHWLVLSLLFLYTAVDEAAALHELLIPYFRNQWNASGWFYFGWVIIGIPLIVLIGFAYLRFWIRLPQPAKTLFFISALLYVSGGLGFEMLGARHADYVAKNFTYNMLVSFEETLEMAGLILFIYALLRYMEDFLPHIQIAIVSGKARSR